MFKVVWFSECSVAPFGRYQELFFLTFEEAHDWAYGSDGPDCFWLSIEPVERRYVCHNTLTASEGE